MRLKFICLFMLMTMIQFFPQGACAGKNNLLSGQPVSFGLNKITFTVSDLWFSRDKAHHFLTSAFFTTTGYYYCREQMKFSNFKSQQGGACFSISLGLIKEVRDGMKANNNFSWKDLVADILGTAIGLALVSD